MILRYKSKDLNLSYNKVYTILRISNGIDLKSIDFYEWFEKCDKLNLYNVGCICDYDDGKWLWYNASNFEVPYDLIREQKLNELLGEVL